MLNNYFGLDVQESYKGEWQTYLNDVDPKYHLALTRAMSNLHHLHAGKAYRKTDEWFTIIYGLVLEMEQMFDYSRLHRKINLNVDNFKVEEIKW